MTPHQIRKIQAINVLVLGDIMLDRYIIGSVKRISPEAPVPVLEVQKEEVRLGGSGNVVHNIRSLGASVRVLSCIGTDIEGKELLEALSTQGVDIHFLGCCAEITTITKTRVVAKNQQLLRYDREKIQVVPPSYVDFLRDNIDAIFNGINIVVISDYEKGGVVPELAQLLIHRSRMMGIPVLVDPKGKDYSKYYGATICTPNLSELSMASGRMLNQLMEERIQKAALELCSAFNFDHLLVTRSEKGMSLIGGDGSKKDFSAIEKEVVDVSGAGDTVASVIALCIAAGFPLDECCRLANQAASIVVSKFGTATVTFNELVGSEIYASNSKLITQEQLPYLRDYLREQGKRIVFTNGCFDLVHAGHISSFQQARDFGDVLIVGLNSDASVHRIKGEKRPIVNEHDRAIVLQSISFVDYVVLFDDETPEELIHEIAPDVLVKGKDWEGMVIAGQKFVESRGGEVRFIDLEQGLSTTNIINRIREVYKIIE